MTATATHRPTTEAAPTTAPAMTGATTAATTTATAATTTATESTTTATATAAAAVPRQWAAAVARWLPRRRPLLPPLSPSPSPHAAAAVLAAHLAVGAVGGSALMGLGAVDAAYWATVTALSVGYGDVTPPGGGVGWARTFVGAYAVVSVAVASRCLGVVGGGAVRAAAAGLGRRAWFLGGPPPPAAAGDGRHLAAVAAVFVSVAAVGAAALGRGMGLAGVGDAAYLVAISASTVGYGDLSPTGAADRAVAVVWLLGLTTSFATLVEEATAYATAPAATAAATAAAGEGGGEGRGGAALVHRELVCPPGGREAEPAGAAGEADYLAAALVSDGAVSQAAVDAIRAAWRSGVRAPGAGGRGGGGA